MRRLAIVYWVIALTISTAAGGCGGGHDDDFERTRSDRRFWRCDGSAVLNGNQSSINFGRD